MKRFIIILCTLALSATVTHAQTDKRSVEATDIEFVHEGEMVKVNFTLNAGRKSTRANYNLVVNPVIRNGAIERQLPSIVIQGHRSKVADERHELATGERRYEQTPVYMASGESLAYQTTLPYEEWMRGGELAFEGVSVGCCSATEVELGLIAENILYAEPEIETTIVEVSVVVPRVTTGEKMAERYPFVAPIEELDMIPATSEGMIAATREGSISVYFPQGSHIIDRNFGDNNRNLVELISAVRAIADAEDSRIAKIVIAGFTSPEGSTALNERLAWNRAVAVKDFLAANTDVDRRVVEIYNGGVDWTGLRDLAASSDLYQKNRIIDIIDNTPIWDAKRKIGRHGQLMLIDGGEPYRYMAREFFPKLRQAAYIKVYFVNN